MSTVDIRQKLHDYIDAAPDKKVEAIFTMVEDEIEEDYDHWEDEEFVAELQRREDNYLKGKSKTYTMEESLERARQAIKK
jgi:hypothetical protein